MKRLIDFSSRFRILKGGKVSLVVSALLGSVTLSFASPSGGTVTSGSADINQSGNTTTITQSTSKASINWQKFDIASNETVNFNQPSKNSITLNRVVGNEKSVIDGALNANGQVWILNSNGILFNSSAKINTAGLVASTKELSDADFNAGNYNLKGDSKESVINMGTIDISNSGYAAFFADNITNEGTINVYRGKIAFVGAKDAVININGNSLVDIKINKGVVDSLIENKGALLANEGEIILTSKALDEILKNVVNNSGIIEAKGMDDVFGEVKIVAEGGHAENSGTIDVSSESGKGGTATVTGYHTMISETGTINADGKTGGGIVQVGGSFQNTDTSVYQAVGTIVKHGAKLTANATDKGDGGTVVAWSDIYNEESGTRAYGTFEAKGGVNGGDGGKVETSGAFLDVNGIDGISTLATKGNAGSWLLDPTKVVIAANAEPYYGSLSDFFVGIYSFTDSTSVIDSTVVQAMLDYTNVTINAVATPYAGDGIIHVVSPITMYSNILSLIGNSISIEAPLNLYGLNLTASAVINTYSYAPINVNGFLYINNAANGNFGGAIGGNGSVVFQNNANITTAASINNPLVQIDAGSALSMSTSANYTNTSFTVNGTLNSNTYNQTIKSLNGSGIFNMGSTQKTINEGSFSGTINGDSNSYLVINGGITLSGMGSYTGQTKISSTGLLLLNGYNALLNSSYLYNDGSLVISSSGATIKNYYGNGTITNYGTSTITQYNNLNTAGIWYGSGTLNLNSNAAGRIFTISGNSQNYAGTVNIGNNMTLVISDANALGGSGSVNIGTGAIYQVNNVTTANLKSLTLSGGTITGSGTIGGAVTLTANTTISPSNNLSFNNTISGNYSLTVNNSSNTTFNGTVSIGSITTNSGGNTIINNNFTTTSSQNYNDAVSVTGARTFTSNSGVLNFNNNLTGNNSLTLLGGSSGLTVNGNINIASNSLTLKGSSSGTGILAANGTLTAGSLLLQNAATANITSDISTIAANGIGALNYLSSGALSIGTVGGVDGISATGTVDVATNSGDLTLLKNVTTSNTSESAMILNAAKTITAGTSTGGNIIINGGTLSVGIGGTAKLYTGSITGSTGLIGLSTLTSGSGRFRYNSNQESSAYSKALDIGLNVIYREQPTYAVAISSASKTYDGAVYSSNPTVSYSLINGDIAGTDFTNGTYIFNGVGSTAINVGEYTIGANIAGFSNTLGYANPTTASAGLLTINKRALNLSGTKVYDGTTNVSSSALSFDNLVSGEDLNLNGTGTIENKNVANGKALTLETLALANGTNGLTSNYTLIGGIYTVDITKADISSISGISASNKVYDGATTAILDDSNATFNGIFTGDVLNVASKTGSFSDENVATNKIINISGLTLGGTDLVNYNLISNTASTTADITAKNLLLSDLVVNNKVYDRTTTGTISNNGTLDGIISGDIVTIDSTNATANFEDWNVADAKAITLGGLTLKGIDALNYTYSLSAPVTANITAKLLGLEIIGTDTRVYDSTTNFQFTNLYTASTTGVISGDSVAADIGSISGFIDKNVGENKQVTFSGFAISGADAGNYQLVSGSAVGNANITKANITSITGITANNKIYDATTNANLVTSGASFTDMFSGDVLEVANATAAFSDKNVANGKTVSITGLTLGGTDSGNYNLTTNTASTNANITPATITSIYGITAQNKIYDRTTNAILDISGANFTNILGSDVLNVATSIGTFANNWNVGSAKTVNITGLTLGGADALNYTLANTTSTTTADITKKQVTLDLQGVATKVYDGTTSLNLNGVTALLNNVISGDEVTVATQNVTGFVNKNVGINKEAIYTGFSLAGTQAENYDIGAGTAASIASITRLNSVTWIGGSTGNWFNPDNWAGKAVPDLSNVANVVIPNGVIVNFDTSAALGLADASGAVNIDSLGSLGSMAMSNGALNVANGATLNSLTQSGGTLVASTLNVNESFSQSNTGILAISGDATFNVGSSNFTLSNSGNSFGSLGVTANNIAISNIIGNLTLANINVGGTLGVNINNDMLQKSGTNIDVNETTTLASTSGNVKLDNATNDFGIINASGKNISLADKNAIVLGNINSNNALNISTNGEISQVPGSKLKVSGVTSLDAGNSNINLTSKENQLLGLINVKGGVVVLETANVPKFGDVQTDKPIKGGKIQTSKIERIIDQSVKQENVNNLNENIFKNINNIVQNKIVNNPLDVKTNLEQKINVDYFTDKKIIQTLQLDPNSKLLTVSQPLDDENTYRVTLNELKDMNKSDIDQNNVLVPLSKNSNVALVNGGVSLPQGLDQEFYVIKAENEKKDN